ncbi:MAG: hypothetical protein Tsb0020_33020 [Haliangiales bacterium]
MADNRSYAAGRFSFEVDGEWAAYIRKVSGGTTEAEISVHNLGTTNLQKKNITNLKHNPVTMEVGMGMGKPLWDWIKASFDADFQVKDCALTAADFNYKAMARRVFKRGYIKKVSLPAFDASNKENAYFTIEIDPEEIEYEDGGGQTITGTENAATKKWMCSNFQFELAGLEDACKRISKIDSMSLEQKVALDQVGEFRTPTKHASSLVVPDISLTISTADIKPWADWHRSFVIQGQSDDSQEKTATLRLLGPDMSEVLCTIDFDHVGIMSLEQEAFEANSENVSRFTVKLYTEKMTFSEYNEK